MADSHRASASNGWAERVEFSQCGESLPTIVEVGPMQRQRFQLLRVPVIDAPHGGCIRVALDVDPVSHLCDATRLNHYARSYRCSSRLFT
jgi:hypothetical protein